MLQVAVSLQSVTDRAGQSCPAADGCEPTFGVSMANPVSFNASAILRRLPSVDELLAATRIRALLATQPRWAVLEAIREVLAECRRRILAGDVTPEAARELVDPVSIEIAVEAEAIRKAGPSLRPVINASGV